MLLNGTDYIALVANIKDRIRNAQYRVSLSANVEILSLYWSIGKDINDHAVWGNKFIDNLSRDIKHDFPNAKGYSVRNLKYMAKFAKIYPDLQFVQTVSAQIPWSHNVAILEKVDTSEKREWYIRQTFEAGWSVRTLEDQIDYQLYERQALDHKVSNFKQRLPMPQSDLAIQMMKDPYKFDFIDYRDGMVEREIEDELVKNITKLLLELGVGFSFIGRQYHIEVENEDFYIDLLFYHVKLHCYVVIELKTGNFKPEYAGKLNFYISAFEDLLKTEHDNPTIGLLLCKNKRGMIAEYALQDIKKPIGVSEFKLFDKLPKEYENILPSADDIEKRLGLSIDDGSIRYNE
jgi:predicted nuclease of restriction endonuclease-like (RecB) superfamily